MKKALALALSLTMMVSLFAGCGSKDSGSTNANTNTNTSSGSQQEELPSYSFQLGFSVMNRHLSMLQMLTPDQQEKSGYVW